MRTTGHYLQMLDYPQFLGCVLHDLDGFGLEELGQISHPAVLKEKKMNTLNWTRCFLVLPRS